MQLEDIAPVELLPLKYTDTCVCLCKRDLSAFCFENNYDIFIGLCLDKFILNTQKVIDEFGK